MLVYTECLSRSTIGVYECVDKKAAPLLEGNPRVFLPMSVFFFISGLAYYICNYLTQHRFTDMVVLPLTNAVIIFMLGLVFEQISQLRMDRTEV